MTAVELCGASSMCESALLDFIHFVQNFHPSIKFTYKISPVSVGFLDLLSTFMASSLHLFSTNLLMPTPTCMSLSHHPNSNTKASIPYAQSALMKTFSCNVAGCLSFSRTRGYPTSVIENYDEITKQQYIYSHHARDINILHTFANCSTV